MSDDKTLKFKFKGILVFYMIGCGFLATLFVVAGIKNSLFSVVQFGILLSIITIFIANILHVKKYELLADDAARIKIMHTNDNTDNNTDEKTIQDKEEKETDDPLKYLKKYREVYYPLQIIVMSIVGVFVEILVFNSLRNTAFLGNPSLLIGLFIIATAFLLLVSANIFYQNKEIQGFKMLGYLFKASQGVAFLSGTAVVINYLGFGQIEYWLGYITIVFLVIVIVEIGIHGITRLINGKSNQDIELKLFILPAMLSGGNPINKLFISLEENIGISLRSTWTIGFIRRNILLIGFIITLFFWLMTSLVQVNPDEQGVIYSFGRINDQQPILPGIHLKLPWPIQTVKIYPVYKVKSFTVGYESDKKGDYLWTRSHSGEEYKLLLGDGKELVSINMQVGYKIGDLYEYLLQYDNPEEKLKAEAYRILLNETVNTNLDNLLSRDRSSFAKMVTQKLQETSENQKLGLEVTSAVLTSIHPPTEIAYEYQEIVSAGIQKQNIITKAKTYADSSIPKAEQERNEMIKTSKVEALTRIGLAYGESDTYLYQQRAYQLNTAAYKQWKWLEVMENALKGKTIYLLDKRLNIQKSGIWLDMRRINTDSDIKTRQSSNDHN